MRTMASVSPARAATGGGARRQPAALGPIGFALLLAGCAPPQPVDPAAFFAAAVAPGEARLDSLAAWRASGRIEAQVDRRRGAGRMRIIHLSPHRLRADIDLGGAFGLLGSRAVLWVDETGLIWQEGSAPPAAVDADAVFAPVLGGAAGVADLEVLLFGLPRLRARWPDETTVEVRASGGNDVVTAVFPDGASEEATVGGSPRALRRLERRDASGRTVLLARFERLTVVGGVATPRHLEIRAPVAGNWIRIDWSRLEANPELPPEGLAWPVP